MAYIANTAFEVRVSNHEFDSVANITGKFQNSTPADEICSAGFLCKRVSLITNEGYSGIKNGNTWIMQAGEATDILYAANPHNVNELTDPVSGNTYKVDRDTLGLPIPAGVEDTFTLIRADGTHIYRFGGPTCLAGDEIGTYSFDHELRVGDEVVFEDMAIYTMVKNNTFNGRNLPEIAIRRENGEIETVRAFGYPDFASRLG